MKITALIPALLGGLLASSFIAVGHAGEAHSVARQWNEELLAAIRRDFARPTVHARNLFHVSAAMWDAWAAYDGQADAVFHAERLTAEDTEAARREAISYAAYRLLRHRFASSPGNDPDDPGNTFENLRQRMLALGYDPDFNNAHADSPAALGLRIANRIIQHGLGDGANEANGYVNRFYQPLNQPLDLDEVGNPELPFHNRWQPLRFSGGLVDQGGNPVGQTQSFLGAEWGAVIPFALGAAELDIHVVPGGSWEQWVYLDPGPPPLLGGPGDAEFKASFARVIQASSHMDPSDGVMVDISPASLGNNSLGSNDGSGYVQNPHTGEPYAPQMVPRGDFLRVMTEFWADGLASETPPGHWFDLLNHKVSEHPQLQRRIGGRGPVVGPLEWDVKAYLALGGAVHDAAIAAWSVKGYYDYVRPISIIRHMAELGQSSDPEQPNYHPSGLPLHAGLIEPITEASVLGPHQGLEDYVGEIAVFAWRGYGYDPETEAAGVGWIRAKEWWPYQQPNFVTPPFGGYVSGHSTFSRAAAELLTQLTGDSYFPGGRGEHCVAQNAYLEVELGPSQSLCLEWARYYDASDQSSQSRIYGGIHPDIDDFPGRIIGHRVGGKAWQLAEQYFLGAIHPTFRSGFESE